MQKQVIPIQSPMFGQGIIWDKEMNTVDEGGKNQGGKQMQARHKQHDLKGRLCSTLFKVVRIPSQPHHVQIAVFLEINLHSPLPQSTQRQGTSVYSSSLAAHIATEIN